MGGKRMVDAAAAAATTAAVATAGTASLGARPVLHLRLQGSHKFLVGIHILLSKLCIRVEGNARAVTPACARSDDEGKK